MKTNRPLVAAAVLLFPVLAHADGANVWSLDLQLAGPESSTTFRGDGRSPDVIFEQGFAPRGDNGDLGQHQIGTSDSAFVSTSKAILAAESFARHNDGAVYVIRDSKGVDVNQTFGKDAVYPDELEVAVPEHIRGDEIVGAWLKDEHGNYTVYVANPNHQPRFRSTDPVLAKDARGTYYDARTGRVLSTEEAHDAAERAKLYKASPAVTLVDSQGEASVALFEWETKGKYGSASVTAGGASASYDVSAGVTKNGVQAHVSVGAKVTVFEAEVKTQRIAGVQASGRAFVGSEVNAGASTEVSLSRVRATGNVSAFHGAKVSGTISQEISLCGVSVTTTHTVDASVGAGVDAKAYFSFDLATGTVKAGGKVAGTVGAGAGYGQEIEISAEDLLKNPKGLLTCGIQEAPKVAWNVTRKGVNGAIDRGTGLAKGGAKKLKKLFGGGGDGTKFFDELRARQGNNTSRNAATTAKPSWYDSAAANVTSRANASAVNTGNGSASTSSGSFLKP